ncbi:DNA polymerase III subunit chi [Wenxinia marina]|uniref:DNA polymerase III, chi subunit n=1 Tax=Wenxinia marina DSM 24838 TaxID=1123501 RepID=A0A0D0P8I9_9RHOB|nr:DNA polymerase III subunit chi [Wenxinia marina]KIQ67891.1 DNA polymerase III, chi subunit [Wenxinia marina DSM 24838]GGL74297.1 DNA polymerase III subunit chi [Wenxinia marina]
MGAAYFYHLTESPLEAALLTLLPRALGQGWRVEVRGRDEGMMERLDRALWTGPEESFLPHGLAGGPHDALQPVLLTSGGAAANRPACVMAVDGADVTAEEGAALERVCVLFDGIEPAAVERARHQWRELTGGGLEGQYWAQEAGKWTRKA